MAVTFLNLPVELRSMIYDLMITAMNTGDAPVYVIPVQNTRSIRSIYPERTTRIWCDEHMDHSTRACRFTDRFLSSPSIDHDNASYRFAMSYRAYLFNLAMTCRALYQDIIPTMYGRSKLTIWTEPSWRYAVSDLKEGMEACIRRFPNCATVQTLNLQLRDNLGLRDAHKINRLVRTYFSDLRELYLTIPLLWKDWTRSELPYEQDLYSRWLCTTPQTVRGTKAAVETIGWLLPGRVKVRIDNSEDKSKCPYHRRWLLLLFKTFCDERNKQLALRRASRRASEAHWMEASRRVSLQRARIREIDVLAQTLEITLSLRSPES